MKLANQIFMLGLFLLSTISLTACSHKAVGNGDAPEVASELSSDVPAEASTDAVPAAVPDQLAAENPVENAAPISDAPASSAPVADAAPVSDSVASNAPVSDAPVADAPVADAPISDMPIAEAPISDMPVTDTALTDHVVADNSATAAPAPDAPSVISTIPAKKGKKFKKGKKASGKVASKASAVPAGDPTSYEVKKGDTLMKIAFEQYGDVYRWKEIYNANRDAIKNPSDVPPGTKLTLNGAGMVAIERNGESYLIKRGDTLGVISNDVYGTTRKWKKLWENNRQLIKDPNRIYAGFYLYYVPEGKLTREEVAPGLKKDDSAMNAPKVGDASRVPASTPVETTPAKN